MSRMIIETPETGRSGTKSSLDFAYWVIQGATQFYTSASATVDFTGEPSDETASVELIRYAASQAGVFLPTEYSMILSMVRTEGTTQPLAKTLRDRGAILFKNRGIAFSLGDGQRMIEASGLEYTLRYFTATEMAEGFWDETARVPGMEYQ